MAPPEIGGLGINATHVNPRFLDQRIERFFSLPIPQVVGDDFFRAVGEVVHIAALRWMQRYSEERRNYGETMQFLGYATRPEICFIYAIDGFGHTRFFVDRTRTERNTTQHEEFLRIFSLTSSAQERQLCEEIGLSPGISTTKGLQLANEPNIPVRRILPSEAPSAVAALAFPESIRASMLSLASKTGTP